VTTLAKIECIYCGTTYINGPTAVSDHVLNCSKHPFYGIQPFGEVDDDILRMLDEAVQASITETKQQEIK
jgi:hypothetical protein